LVANSAFLATSMFLLDVDFLDSHVLWNHHGNEKHIVLFICRH
jgi:hypothetical protein